jgi:hypothetical protein
LEFDEPVRRSGDSRFRYCRRQQLALRPGRGVVVVLSSGILTRSMGSCVVPLTALAEGVAQSLKQVGAAPSSRRVPGSSNRSSAIRLASLESSRGSQRCHTSLRLGTPVRLLGAFHSGFIEFVLSPAFSGNELIA